MKLAVLIAAVATVAASSATELFNGKDLSGWTEVKDHDVTGGYCPSEPTWSVVDGAIRTTGSPFGYLRTKRNDFGDFKLRLEYRWWRQTEKPNSGVFVRLTGETGAFIPTCYENQLCPAFVCDLLSLGGSVIDGATPARPYNAADPLSGIAKVHAKGESPEKPFGEWNVLEVEVRGDELVNRLNGVERNRVKGLVSKKGAIALQAEGGAVEFRNLTIQD